MLDPFLTEPQNIGYEFSAYGREGLEKVFKGESVGEIIKQSTDWNALAFKNWRAVKNFRIAGNEGLRRHGEFVV
jgi:hypothetical protein